MAQKLQIKKVSKELLQELYSIACEYKAQKQKLEELQAFKNSASKEFAALRAQNKATDELKTKLDSNKQEMQEAQKKLEKMESALTKISYTIPNLPDSKTPEGEDEHDNIEIKKILEPRAFDFEPKEHWELANKNGWIDFEAGVRLAKSRVLRGMGARLNRALINFMLDYNQKAGFEAVVTPVIVNKNCLFGTGQLPKFEADMFKISNQDFEELDSTNMQTHDLYLISTSEITLTNLYNDTIIPKSDLPIMLTAQTPCFRKEAGSAGKTGICIGTGSTQPRRRKIKPAGSPEESL